MDNIFTSDRDKRLIRTLYLIAFVCLLLFLALTLPVVQQSANLQSVDQRILLSLQALRTGPLNYFFLIITTFANRITQIIVTIVAFIILCLLHHYREGLWMAVMQLTASYGVNHLVKYVVGRPRPTVVESLVSEGTFSYPSGHAMGALMLYGGLVFLICHLVGVNTGLKKCLYVLTGLIVLLIGVSRLYVGVHYPSDVLAGFLLGGACLSFAIALYYRFVAKNDERIFYNYV